MDIVSRIESRLAHMRPAEQKVSQYILQNLKFSAAASIDELADKAGVSKASITRLAQALDCKNVRELKLQLAQSVAVGERFIDESSDNSKRRPPVYRAIFDILELNTGLISEQVAKDAAQAIVNARHTLLFGVGGGSALLAQECHNRLFRLDVLSNAYSDPMMMRMTASTVNKGDVVICLSLSGVSPDVLASAQIAQEYGATIVCICPSGTLSDIADIHLPIKTREQDYIFNPSASRYVMMAAVDILASEVAVFNQKKSREKLRRIKHQLDEHRQGHDRLPLGD